MSATATNDNPRETALSAWGDLAALAPDAGKPDLMTGFVAARERLELGLFRLVVMGEIKKGKSSFINGLIGCEGLLPVDSDIATSTVFKVIYGPEKGFKVFFHPDPDSGTRPPPLPIDPVNLPEYGTEGGNPGNSRNVDFIGIEVPCPLLRDGLVLVDTPGVGGLYKAHRDVTWKYAPNADAVLFVLDSVETVISLDEIKFLRELIGKITKRVFFVQTKTDAAGTEQAQTWQARNIDVLSKELNLPRAGIRYFPVSSKLKGVADRRNSLRHLKESGFPAVLEFIQHQLMREKQRHLAQALAFQLETGTRVLGADFTERREIIAAAQQAGLETLRKEYEDARSALDSWQRVECPKEMKQFNRDFAALKKTFSARIQDELDPTGPISSRLIDNIRNSELTAEMLNEKIREIQQECVSFACESTLEIHKDFNEKANTLLVNTIRRLGKGLHAATSPTVAPDAADKANLNPEQFAFQDSLSMSPESIFSWWREVAPGIGLFSTVATTAGVFFPPMAMATGLVSALGLIFSVYLQRANSPNRRRDEALAKLRQVLQDLLRKVHRAALGQFDNAAIHFEQGTEEQIQKAIGTYREQLETRLRQVNEAKGKSAGQFKADLEEIAALEIRMEKVNDQLKAIRPSPTPNPK